MDTRTHAFISGEQDGGGEEKRLSSTLSEPEQIGRLF